MRIHASILEEHLQETLDQSAGPLGRLWVELDGLDYPEQGWVDFVTVVLDWWCVGCASLLERKTRKVEFLIMDGPFALTVSAKGDDGAVTLRSDDRVRQVKVTEFAAELLKAVDQVRQQLSNVPGAQKPHTALTNAASILRKACSRSASN